MQPEDQEAPECKASCCCCCARILHGGLALAGSAPRTSCERTEPAGCAEAVGRCSFGLRLLPTSGVHALLNRSEKERGSILLGVVHTTNGFRTNFGASQKNVHLSPGRSVSASSSAADVRASGTAGVESDETVLGCDCQACPLPLMVATRLPDKLYFAWMSSCPLAGLCLPYPPATTS